MGTAVHTGVGWGAIRPSGRSVQPNGLTDFAFVHGGQYGTKDTLVFSDSGVINGFTHATYIDSFSFTDSNIVSGMGKGSYTDSSNQIVDTVFDNGLTKGATAETFSPTDSANQSIAHNSTKTDGMPIADSLTNTGLTKGNTIETLPVTDTASHP